jgi:hypothetical protein
MMLLNDLILAMLWILRNKLKKVIIITYFEIKIRGKTLKRNSD